MCISIQNRIERNSKQDKHATNKQYACSAKRHSPSPYFPNGDEALPSTGEGDRT